MSQDIKTVLEATETGNVPSVGRTGEQPQRPSNPLFSLCQYMLAIIHYGRSDKTLQKGVRYNFHGINLGPPFVLIVIYNRVAKDSAAHHTCMSSSRKKLEEVGHFLWFLRRRLFAVWFVIFCGNEY